MDTDKARSSFVEAGPFDCKTLANKLPVTAQELRDGTTTANEVACTLLHNEFWYLPKKENPDEKVYSKSILFLGLTREVLLSNSNTIDFADQPIELLAEAFYHDLLVKLDDFPLSENGLKENGFFATGVESIQRAFDKTLEMERWKSLIQNSTGLPLQEACNLYKVSSDKFLTFSMEMLSKKFDTSQLHDTVYEQSLIRKGRSIAMAAEGVAEGLDRIETTCWECGTCSQVRRCSQCHVARYCSPECQMKSWKGGHKKVCKEMKGSFGGFVDDLELIDKAAVAAAQDDTEAMLKTNAVLDYIVLQTLWISIFQGEANPLHVFKLHGCPEPSMAVFHQNVLKIAQGGGHWLFANQGIETSDDPIAPTKNEKLVVLAVANLLCYDTSALENDPQNMARLHMRFRGYLRTDNSGTALTAKRFVQVYKFFNEFREPFDDKPDSKTVKCDCQARVLKHFKEKYNKHD